MLRRFAVLAVAAAALAVPVASHAATCAGPVSQNCTYTNDEGELRHCAVFAGTGSNSSDSFVCMNGTSGTVHIGG